MCGLAQLCDLVQALLGAGRIRAGHHELRQGAIVGGHNRVHAHHALDILDRGNHGIRFGSVGDDEDRLCLSRREVVREDLETGGRFGLHPELLDLVEPD